MFCFLLAPPISRAVFGFLRCVAPPHGGRGRRIRREHACTNHARLRARSTPIGLLGVEVPWNLQGMPQECSGRCRSGDGGQGMLGFWELGAGERCDGAWMRHYVDYRREISLPDCVAPIRLAGRARESVRQFNKDRARDARG